VTHNVHYSRPLPEGTRTIAECESVLDRLILGQYSADHSPNGTLHGDGVRRMYLRMFDRNGGEPLPQGWRSMRSVKA
jgi:hypothetical protein